MFRDRRDAGRRLAQELVGRPLHDPVVFALPRGGVPVADEVASALDAPLDVLIVRKLGHPRQPELAVGAIGEDGVRILDPEMMRLPGVTDAAITDVERREQAELQRRVERYRRGFPGLDVRGRTVVLVDDGIATGSTARAGIRVLRRRGAGRVVLAVPVASPHAVADLAAVADDVVCPSTPRHLQSIGQWYEDFTQVGDEEVARVLAAARRRTEHPSSPAPAGIDRTLGLRVQDGPTLPVDLVVPPEATGLIVFAHGSGSSRASPRNVEVARRLNRRGLATALMDLLSPSEARDRANVFDIALLADRVTAATRLLAREGDTAALPIGLFGASTGAAAALVAAARLGELVRAVVSRGGRADMASTELGDVRAATLLIVGERDPQVLRLNREARARLRCVNDLVIVPGATHLFEEPGALETVAATAADWFLHHLGVPVRGEHT